MLTDTPKALIKASTGLSIAGVIHSTIILRHSVILLRLPHKTFDLIEQAGLFNKLHLQVPMILLKK
jgi:hypothetical protein